MHILMPSDIAVLFTLGAAILAGVTALMLCLQRPRDQIQAVTLRDRDAGGICQGDSRLMALSRTPTENLALKLLARGGIAAIWQLHIAAAQAHRKGCPRAAAMVSEIAEAAEEAWLRAEGERALL